MPYRCHVYPQLTTLQQIDGYYTDEEPPAGTIPPPLALAGGRNAKPKIDSDSEVEAPKRGRPKGVTGSAKRKRVGKAIETVSIIDDEEEIDRPAPVCLTFGLRIDHLLNSCSETQKDGRPCL